MKNIMAPCPAADRSTGLLLLLRLAVLRSPRLPLYPCVCAILAIQELITRLL